VFLAALPGLSLSGTMNAISVQKSPPGVRRALSPRVRRAVLTAHIVASVGLLGDVAAVLAVNVRAAISTDPGFASASYDLLQMFSFVFGIPLSFAALLTGLTLGLGSKWGVLRHAWVTAKLMLLLSVILVGALVIGPATAEMANGSGDAETVLIAAAAWDVLALTVATALSVYKPRLLQPPRSTNAPSTQGPS
jgi:Predicted integral membrane protein (DUF2269)